MNPDTLVYGVTTMWANSTVADDFLTVLLNVAQMFAPPTASFQVYSKSNFVLAAIEEILHFNDNTKIFYSLPSRF